MTLEEETNPRSAAGRRDARTERIRRVPQDFHDFPTDWSAAGLRSAVQNGLLNGSNGEIDGNGLLTRAQLAAIVNRAFGADKAADLYRIYRCRRDTWYHNDMAVSVAMGAFQGANGKLNPESPITREEAFAVLARAFGLDGDASALSDYTDGGSVSPWAKSAVSALIDSGFVNGANGRTQSPEQHHPCGIRQGHQRHGEHVRG